MKRLLPTVLLVLALAAGYLYAKSENYFREEEKPSSTLFTLAGSDVSSLKLVSGGETIELKRKDDGTWDMLKPAAYPVEKISADGLAESMGDLKYATVIEENPESLAEFGLDKPMREVEAVLKDGSSKKLLVGNPLPVTGTTYVKAADGTAVYEMEDSVLGGVTKTAEDLLNKTVLKMEYDKVTAVEVEWKGEKWKLAKADRAKKAYESAWKIGDKELKPEEGSAILDKLMFLTTDRLPKGKSEVDWNGAELKLTLTQDDSGKDTVLTYKGKIENELVRIAADDGVWAYAIGADSVQEIWDLGKK